MEREGQRFVEKQSGDVDEVYSKLWKETLWREGDVLRENSPEALDKYLAVQAASLERLIEYPNISEQYVERQTENATKELKETRAALEGNYYKEKPEYCLQRVEKLRTSFLTEAYTKEHGELPGHTREEIAAWLRTAANCLTMPEARPKASPPQSQDQ